MPDFLNLQKAVNNSSMSEFPHNLYKDIAANCLMLMSFLELHDEKIHYGDIARDFASQKNLSPLEEDKLTAEARLRRVINDVLQESATRNQFIVGLKCLSYLAQIRPLPEDKVIPLARLEQDIRSLL